MAKAAAEAEKAQVGADSVIKWLKGAACFPACSASKQTLACLLQLP